jgi:hypothetical protein
MTDIAAAKTKCQRTKTAMSAGVAIAAHERGPGKRETKLRSDHVDDALLGIVDVKRDAEFLDVAALGEDKGRALRVATVVVPDWWRGYGPSPPA